MFRKTEPVSYRTSVVASGNEDARPGTSGFAGDREDIISAQSLKRKTPTSPETIPTDVPLTRKKLQNKGFFSTGTNNMEASWRSGTRRHLVKMEAM